MTRPLLEPSVPDPPGAVSCPITVHGVRMREPFADRVTPEEASRRETLARKREVGMVDGGSFFESVLDER